MQSSPPILNRRRREPPKIVISAAALKYLPMIILFIFFALIQTYNLVTLYDVCYEVLDITTEYFTPVNQTLATNVRFRYIFTIGVWSDESMKSHWSRAREGMFGALETEFYSRKLQRYHETLTTTINLPFQGCNTTYDQTYLDELITQFRSFDNEIKRRHSILQSYSEYHQQPTNQSSEKPTINIPTNLIPISPFKLKTNCVAEKYSSMDIIYKACNDTGVECGHIVWLREPYEIVQDIDWGVKMRAVRHVATLIPRLSTALSIIGSQMLMYPDQLVACVDYEDATMDMDLFHQQNFVGNRWKIKRGIFRRTSSLEKPGVERAAKISASKQRIKSMNNAHNELYMDDLISVSDFVRSLCVRKYAKTRIG